MALVFEYEKELVTGNQPFISHEPDSVLYNYFVDNEMALDRSAAPSLGYYDNTEFSNEERHLTTRAVSRIGIKNFPGIGGMGFYRDAYSDECLVVAPIHVNRSRLGTPILKVAEIVDNRLHIVIEPPENISYTCYRIVARQGYFAFEYITYKTEYYMDVPTVKGDYQVFCFGYDEDTSVVSEYSNELTLTVVTGTDDWAPYFETVADMVQRVENLETDVEEIQTDIGDIGALIDEINGVEV